MLTEVTVPELPLILSRLAQGVVIERREIKTLLGLSRPDDIFLLFRTARMIRHRHFKNQIFLYGFLYFSTFCRNNYSFLQYQKANTSFDSYRKDKSEILKAAREMADSGVHLVDIIMGEDPEFYLSGDNEFQGIIEMVSAVKKETGLQVMISPETPRGNMRELIVIAVMRLLFPNRLISAYLDVDGMDALKARLDAGANVITYIVPPEKEPTGPAKDSLDIEDAGRIHDNILPILNSCGLEIAEKAFYSSWLNTRRHDFLNI